VLKLTGIATAGPSVCLSGELIRSKIEPQLDAMLSTYIILSLVITAIHGTDLTNDGATFTDLISFPAHELSGQPLKALSFDSDISARQGSDELQERAITFKPYSFAYSRNRLEQWVFGNATRQFNISISSCLRMGDVVGVYQFDDGTMKYDATARDIAIDLGLGTSRGTHTRFAARTLINAQLAYKEVEAFLIEDILVEDSSPSRPKQRRQVEFQSNGRINALVWKSASGLLLGICAAEIANGFNTTSGQLWAGAITSAGFIALYSIIDIVTQEGGLTAFEPAWMQKVAVWVANLFMAMLRKLTMSARGAPDNGQARWTEAELAAELERQDILSVWDAATTPESASSFGLQGFQCDESPV